MTMAVVVRLLAALQFRWLCANENALRVLCADTKVCFETFVEAEAPADPYCWPLLRVVLQHVLYQLDCLVTRILNRHVQICREELRKLVA